MHAARPFARPRSGRRLSAASGVLLGAGALLVLGAATSQAAVGDAKVTHSSSSDAGMDAGVGFGYQADTVTSTSLPAGGLVAALVLAGAGTVMATRAMCSGRGWR